MTQIEIVANGRRYQVASGSTVEEFLEERGLPASSCVVELNGEALGRSDFPQTTLSDGDRIEIVKAVAGGGPRADDSERTGPAVRRTRRLAVARLYFVSDAHPVSGSLRSILTAAVSGGAGIIQLRDRKSNDRRLVDAARVFREVADENSCLFIVNDRPDIALASGADGVHLGQDDLPVEIAREIVGPDLLIGISTHTEAEITAAGDSAADYIGVGPVFATPTKPGRRPVGTELVEFAAAHSALPFFAIGGIDVSNVGQVVRAGARRIAVVRAIANATDPGQAARELVDALTHSADRVPAWRGRS